MTSVHFLHALNCETCVLPDWNDEVFTWRKIYCDTYVYCLFEIPCVCEKEKSDFLRIALLYKENQLFTSNNKVENDEDVHKNGPLVFFLIGYL